MEVAKKKVAREEAWAVNAAMPVRNRSMAAAIRLKGRVRVYDPNFM